jgi:hypothetical protein
VSSALDTAVPIPGVGICSNDLALLGKHMLTVLGWDLTQAATLEDVYERVIGEATWEVMMLCKELEDIDEAAKCLTRLRNLRERLELAEHAKLVIQLSELPSLTSEGS